MMEAENQYEIILAYASADQLLAIALKEWLESDKVSVLLAALPLAQSGGMATTAQMRKEGMLAMVIHSENWGAMDLESTLAPLIERARAEWRPFLYACKVSISAATAVGHDLPVHWLEWEGSFRALSQSLVQELVGRGWQRPASSTRKVPPASNAPRGGNQTIKGNRNIQIGGDLNTGSGFTLNT